MRAKPLPPEERRAAIVAAARPLLAQMGPSVSTKDVAEAAGIAEGTLFRVFATKDELIEAVLADVMDPQATCTAIRLIPAELSLEDRLTAVMDILTDRIREVTGFFLALRLAPNERDEAHARAQRERHRVHTAMVNDAILHAIGTEVDHLRVTPHQAAGYLSSVAFVTGHPMLGSELDLSSTTAVQLMLHGLLDPAATPATPAATPAASAATAPPTPRHSVARPLTTAKAS